MAGDLVLAVVMLFSGELLTVLALGGLGWLCCVMLTVGGFPFAGLSPRPLPTCAREGGGEGWEERCSGGVAARGGGAREEGDCLAPMHCHRPQHTNVATPHTIYYMLGCHRHCMICWELTKGKLHSVVPPHQLVAMVMG